MASEKKLYFFGTLGSLSFNNQLMIEELYS